VEAKKEGGPSRAGGIKVPKVEDHADLHRQTGGSDMKFTTVGMDIGKSVMQLYYINAETGEIVNKPVKRVAFLELFVNRSPCLIGMEACGGSQHWARKLTAMCHQVKLMPAKFVKTTVSGYPTSRAALTT
jgi:hypothetical protein